MDPVGFFFSLVLAVCVFLFLFSLFALGNDDVILLRKNITMEQMFNRTFLILALGLFFARFFYVVFHWSPGYLNPLVFFLFPYFPGLSLAGGVFGATVFLLFSRLSQKAYHDRFLDFLSLSLLFTIPIGMLGDMGIRFFLLRADVRAEGIVVVAYILLAMLFSKVLLPGQQKAELKDGSISFLFLFAFSCLAFLNTISETTDRVWGVLHKDDFLLMVVFSIAVFFLFYHERLYINILQFFSSLFFRKRV